MQEMTAAPVILKPITVSSSVVFVSQTVKRYNLSRVHRFRCCAVVLSNTECTD